MDVMFLCGETPTWHMHVSGVVVLDPSTAPGGFTVAGLREVLATRLPTVPQFRWKLREVPFGLDRPLWVDDAEFDLSFHFHCVALPSPGTREQLGDLVGELAARKLDRSRPLWEVWIIEGLEGGRVAVLTKIHHALIDGASGADLASLLMDLGPEPRVVDVPPVPPPETTPSAVELTIRGVAATLALPLRLAGTVVQLAQQGLSMGTRMRGHTRAGLPFQAPATSFNRRLGAERGFAFADVALADVRRVKDVFGVKVNDVVLTLVAGALRSYLVNLDGLPHRPLIAQVPVSLRTDETRAAVGTFVGTMFASLNTHLADPVERLLAIHESADSAKEMQHVLTAQRKASLADVPPPALVSLFAHAYTAAGLEGRLPPIFNLIVSNVPGPPFELYMAGARVVATYPLGPLLYGSGVNATVFSLGTTMHFGFLTCPGQVPDPWAIADGIPAALAELLVAADARTPLPRQRTRQRTRVAPR
jgi:WS/DGAT/MGAT family acyltransferase